MGLQVSIKLQVPLWAYPPCSLACQQGKKRRMTLNKPISGLGFAEPNSFYFFRERNKHKYEVRPEK